MHRIFIGYDPTQAIAAWVLRESILSQTRADVQILFLNSKFLEFRRAPDPLQSTEFTYTRFMVPSLCGFQGYAIFMDCDMLCLGDIEELLRLEPVDKALSVVQQEHNPILPTKMGGKPQTVYPRKNWSSLMYLNNARLQAWGPEVVESAPSRVLHRFEGIPDSLIGSLPQIWNCLDLRQPGARLLHYTSGGPWLADCEDHPEAVLWWEQAKRAGFKKDDESFHRARDLCEASSFRPQPGINLGA